MDAMDVAGDNHLEMDHDMWKQRLGPDGAAIGEAFTEVVSKISPSSLCCSFAKGSADVHRCSLSENTFAAVTAWKVGTRTAILGN